MHQEASGSFFATPAPSAWDALRARSNQDTVSDFAEFMRRHLDCAAAVITIAQPSATMIHVAAPGEEPVAWSHVCAIAPAVGGMESGGKVLSNPARLADPIEAGDLGFGFYVGIPLRVAAGCNVGTLAAIDVLPRDFAEGELARLKMLANIFVELIGFRLTTSKRDSSSTLED